MHAAVDPNLTDASDQFLGYIADNGAIVVGVVAGLSLFGLGIRWVKKLTAGKAPTT